MDSRSQTKTPGKRPQALAVGSHWAHMDMAIAIGHGQYSQHLPSGSFLMKKNVLEFGHWGGLHGSSILKNSSDSRQEVGKGQ